MTRFVTIGVAVLLVGGAVYAGTDGPAWIRGVAATVGGALALVVVAGVAEIWRRATTPPGDGYGPYPDDADRFQRHVRRIARFDPRRAERYKVQRRLRTAVRRALDARRLERARAHEEKALEIHRDWTRDARAPRRERRALEETLAADLRRLATARYLRAAQAMVERAEGLKTERGRQSALAEAREILAQGAADAEADVDALERYARDAGLRAGPAPTVDRPPATDPTPSGARPTPAPPVRPAEPQASRESARWYPAGTPVTVSGYRIGDGMLLVGTPPIDAAADGPEPACIDPSLALARPDRRGKRLSRGTFVAYADLPPSGRAGFLDWCCEGRDDADAPEAFLLLFLAGVERRLFLRSEGGAPAADESARLAAELVRLARLHGSARTFRRQVAALLDHLVLQGEAYGRAVSAERGRGLACELGEGEAIPIRVRALLARGSTPASLVLALADAWSGGRASSQAARAPGEFEALVAVRADAADWSAVDFVSGRLRTAYRPVNAGFAGAEVTYESDVHDLSTVAVGAHGAEAQRIAQGAAHDLRPVVLWRREHEGAAVPFDVLARLPLDALRALEEASSTPPALAALRELIRGGDLAPDGSPRALLVVDLQRAARASDRRSSAALSKADCGRLAELLAMLGVGVEPDPRLGGARWPGEGRVACFRLRADALRDGPSTGEARAATLFVELAAALAAASADGSGPSDDGLLAARAEALTRRAERAFELAPAERQRVAAHALYRLHEGTNARGARARFADLDEATRDRFARLLVDLARADGTVAAEEVEALEGAYRALGFDPARVHDDLHRRRGATDDGRPSETPSLLDERRVRAMLAETEAVAGLLGNIFTDDEPEASAAPPAVAAAGPHYAGLDDAHSRVLDALRERGGSGVVELPRAEFDRICHASELFPDGALEALNDAAFERADAPLFEGDDPFDLDLDVLAALRSSP